MYHEMIKEICSELNIKCTILSKGWIIMLEKENVTKYISGYKFDLNAHGLGNVLDDKYATYEVLQNKGISVVDYDIIYNFNNKNEYAIGCNNVEYLEKIFSKYNNNIVLKINSGTCGLNVYHISDLIDLKNTFYSLTNKYYSFSISPYYEIENEYRAIFLNNEIKILYKKCKPIVFGDGKSTIKELLCNFNEKFFKDFGNKIGNKILKENEFYEYDWRFNLSCGAIASKSISEETEKIVTSLALKTAKCVNLCFGSIDIIKTIDDEFYILEINSGVMLKNYILQFDDGYVTAKKIYKEAIEKMFEI